MKLIGKILSTRPWEPNLERKPGIGFWPIQGWIWQVLYILYSLEVGVFLIFLPWLGIWENNYLLYRYPVFHPLIANPYFRGAVLGLGIVNILLGIQEIAQFRKNAKNKTS